MRAYSKMVLFIVLSLLTLTRSAGQADLKPPRHRSIGLKISLLRNTMRDGRLSARPFKRVVPGLGLQLERRTEQRWHTMDLDFAHLPAPARAGPLQLSSIVSSLQHIYRWKVGAMWVGGNSRHSTVLNFPVGGKGFFRNSPISYTIAQSIGPSIGYSTFQLSEASKYTLRATADLNLFSYLIQPIHGHPYPARFLEPDVFSPTRAGMAGPLLRSGRLSGPGRFRSFRVQVGICYRISNHFQIGLGLMLDHAYANANGKAVCWQNQQLTVTGSYVY